MPVVRSKYAVPVSDVHRYVVDNNPKSEVVIGRNADNEVFVISSLGFADTATLLDEYDTELGLGHLNG